MKRFIILLFLAVSTNLYAQDLHFNPDSTVTTNHAVTIKGQSVKFSATTGTQPVWDKATGKARAGVFFTYYKRTDVNDADTRPLVFSFNGGPGAGALWMRLAYTGPHRVLIDDEGFPIQPYGIEDNPYSILDIADIVYVEPVNTGFSRPVNGYPAEQFFGVKNDIAYLSEWITTFVTRNNRWVSPKYLIGESYGTTRVAGIAAQLQSRHWMYINGVVLVSPTNLGIRRDGPVADANRLPYYAATAWYFKKMPSDLQQRDLEEILPEVEKFTLDELIPSLARGGFLEDSKRQEIAQQMSRYMGISSSVILDHNLIIPAQFFWKELLRKEGYTIGRLDSRYLGIDRTVAGQAPDYSPEYTSWQHTFTPANNYYYTNYLNYHTDHEYYVAGQTRPWPRDGDQVETSGEDLRKAMAMNPFMHIMVQYGYYDGATDYFNAKYNFWAMDPSGKLKDRMHFKGYRSGHMMYLRHDDLITSNEDVREFIKTSIPAKGVPAKYSVN